MWLLLLPQFLHQWSPTFQNISLNVMGEYFTMKLRLPNERMNNSSIIIIIIALQHSEDLDRVNEEQKLVLNEDES